MANGVDHEELVKWVQDSEDSTEDSRELSEKCRDYYDSRQWTDAEKKNLELSKQAPTVSNRIKPKMDSLMGMETTNKTTAKAFPRTQKHQKSSEAATEAIRFVLQDNDFDSTRSASFENMLLEGTGGCEVIVKSGKKEGEYKIVINPIFWDRIFYDPHSRRKDFSDARYLGQIVWMDYDEAVDLYPDGKDVLETMSNSNSNTYEDKPRWMDGTRRRVKIVEIYYKEKKDVYYATFTLGGYLKDPKKSPFIDEEGKTEWPYEFASLFVERDGGRYGAARQLLDMQDEINKRRSKALHLMSVRQVRGEKGAVEDVNAARRELAKPDGYIETTPGMEFEVLKTGDMASAQFQLLSEAKIEIDAVGANAAMMGKTQNQDASGRALLARENAGKTELAPVFNVLKGWDYRVYRKVWNRIKQYWKGEIWIRVTDDEQNLRWVGLNKPMTKGEMMMQQAQEQKAPPEAIQQLMMQIQQDPSMKEIVNTDNDISELDVDLILDDVPDAITSQIEDFQALSEMVKSGFPIPPIAVIEASPLTNKDKILKLMKEQPQVPPQVQEQMKKMQEEGAKLQEENTQLKANTQVEGAKLQAKTQSDQQQMQMKAAAQQEEFALKRQLQTEEMALAREKAFEELKLKREIAEAEHGIEKEQLDHDKFVAEQKLTIDKEAGDKKIDLEKQKMQKETAAENEVETEAVAPKILQTMESMVKEFSKALESRDKTFEELIKAIAKPKTVTLGGIKRDGEGKLTGASATTH